MHPRRALATVTIAVLAGCGSDLKHRTHAFVAPTPCGQGPYDIHLVADGTTGADGIEVVACTPRRIAGHVQFKIASHELASRSFGEAADNQRCTGGTATAITQAAGDGAGAPATTAPAGTASAAAPTLVARPFTGSERPSSEQLCAELGLETQQILIPTILVRTGEHDLVQPGADLHVRLWSDVPNDLEGVVFLVRQLTSKKTPQQMKAEEERRAHEYEHAPVTERSQPKTHGPPPPPLAEERPSAPTTAAVWIPGYWSWTGSQWGWIAGFWRDERVAMPAPQLEIPGAAPYPDAIWIGGTWTLRAGRYVWVHGRWRR
jgi:hypothetical protein